jgi:hypothetical protein
MGEDADAAAQVWTQLLNIEKPFDCIHVKGPRTTFQPARACERTAAIV